MGEQRDFYRATPRLSVEGTREILDEIENGPRDTPERRATLEGARKWRDKIERYFREVAPETPARTA